MFYEKDAICSETLIPYLTNKGWVTKPSKPNIAILRKFWGDEEQEIVLPIDRTFSDYHLRVREAIQFLATLEGTTARYVLEDLYAFTWVRAQETRTNF